MDFKSFQYSNPKTKQKTKQKNSLTKSSKTLPNADKIASRYLKFKGVFSELHTEKDLKGVTVNKFLEEMKEGNAMEWRKRKIPIISPN